jgi:hypothetical protein
MARLILLVVAVATVLGIGPGFTQPARAEAGPSFLQAWGVFGTGPGQFSSPHGIASDGADLIYVADSFNSRIQVFSRNGVFRFSLGQVGVGNGQFTIPHGVAVDALGIVYVADTGTSRVQAFGTGPIVLATNTATATSSATSVPTETATATPTASAPPASTETPVASATPTQTPSPPPTSTLVPTVGTTATLGAVSACSPRPTVQVRIWRSGTGQLGVTVTGGLASLSRLDIGVAGRALDNAVVDIVGGPSGVTTGLTMPLPQSTSTVELRVRRLDASRPVTVPLTVADGCGPWSTFVGGGPGAF